MNVQSSAKTVVDDVPQPLNRSGYVVCDHVGKSFDVDGEPFRVLDRVNLSIADGEFVSLLGPSGCGKSTLLMMIGGLESITDGGITIDGRLVEGPDTKIGTMFQDPTLLPWKSALDNVLFPIKMMRRPRAKYEARAHELLEMAGLRAAQDLGMRHARKFDVIGVARRAGQLVERVMALHRPVERVAAVHFSLPPLWRRPLRRPPPPRPR